MTLPAQSGSAGPPQWAGYYQRPAYSGSFRQGSFTYCVALGIAIGIGATLALPGALAFAAGFVPLALWLIWFVVIDGIRWCFAKVRMAYDVRRYNRRVRAAAKAPKSPRISKPDRLRIGKIAAHRWDFRVHRLREQAAAEHLTRPASTASAARQAVTQAVLERAVRELGLPYISKDALLSGREVTGDGIGWDCSSLVKWAWEAGGVELPDGADAQYKSQVMLDSSTALQPGDLLFFGTKDANGVYTATHVGLYVNGDDGPRMIAASHKDTWPKSDGGVKVGKPKTKRDALWGKEVYIGASRPGQP
ncbi:MAG: C40 family peptidase [Gaiellaceae bacterium]